MSAVEKKKAWDDVWKRIRKQKTFTVPELAKEADVTAVSIRLYVKSLIKAGYVAVHFDGGYPHIYKLVKDAGSRRPELDIDGQLKEPDNKQKIWRSIKVLKSFTIRDIALCTECKLSTIKTYLGKLIDAGYVVVSKMDYDANDLATKTTYRFNRNRDTGPRAPLVKADGAVFDQNVHQVVFEKEANL